MDCSIIIVNFNTVDLTLQCLKSVFSNLPKKYSTEVFIVDNASSDKSVEIIRKKYPQCMLISNTKNAGFAAANNQGIKQSTGRFILLLNSDTIVLPEAIENTLDYFEKHPEAGIVGGRLYYPGMKFQNSCAQLPSIFHLFNSYILHKPGDLYEPSRYEFSGPVGCVIGAFLMIDRSLVEKIGPLNEKYFMNSEDIDWCFRCWKNHREVHYCAEAHVIHLGGQSSGKRKRKVQWELHKNRIKYFYYNHGPLQAGLASVIMFISFAKHVLVFTFKKIKKALI